MTTEEERPLFVIIPIFTNKKVVFNPEGDATVEEMNVEFVPVSSILKDNPLKDTDDGK